MAESYGVKYVPILKQKGFCPNPVAVKGIPYEVDSVLNPKCVDTMVYQQWWEEQIHYCLNGYDTGGLHIPGRYYWYLNFCYITTVNRGKHKPEYVDFDLEYFRLVDEVKKMKKGIIGLKARRRGWSEKWAKGVVGYECRFRSDSYKAGIAAGVQSYADNLFSKVKMLNTDLPPEFRIRERFNNNEEVVYGYEVYTDSGYIESGSRNQVIVKTMLRNPNILKSNYFNDVAFEEAGEFDLLIRGFNATRDCFAVGDEMVGTPYVFGTGGDIKHASKDFRTMYYQAEDFSLVRLCCFAPRLYIQCFVGSVNQDGVVVDDTPYIRKKYPPEKYSYEQTLGMEDCERALERIQERRAELARSGDKKKLHDFMQNNPTNEKEAFLSFSGNPFDHIKLGEQEIRIISNPLQYTKFRLHFVKDEHGMIKQPYRIELEKVDDDTEDEKCVLILNGGHPVPNTKDLDVAGIDSYDIDQADASRSLGSMVVLRRNNQFAGVMKNTPVALIRQRPPRKEMFYEECLKLSVFYNLVSNSESGNVMIDFHKPLIIDYFKNNGGRKYLARRPLSFESADSQQTHEYGVMLTSGTRSKPQAVGLLQSFIVDYSENIWFPQLIYDIQHYDVTVKDSDSDAADALMLAIIRDVDMKKFPRKFEIDSTHRESVFAMPDYGDSPEKKKDPFGMMLKRDRYVQDYFEL